MQTDYLNNIIRKCFIIHLFLIVTFPVWAGNVHFGDIKITFDKYWKFETDPYNNGIQEKWYVEKLNDDGWNQMEVPGNWDLHNEYANYKGKAWYRTTFKLPLVSDKRILLAFGEVGMSYKVFVNGKSVAAILCGNYEEQFDITDIVHQNKINSLAVEVDNSLSWGAYWSWGGIRRPVTILIREPLYIDRQEIIANPDLSTGTAAVFTAIYLNNTRKSATKISLQQDIYFNGTLIHTSKPVLITLDPEKLTKINLTGILEKEKVQLWHFDHPNLYTSKITLLNSGKKIFEISDRFGIRKIEIDGYQFKLNGQSVRLAGYNWVADDRTTGNTLPQFRFKQDIDMMKSAGANMARISHRPLPSDVMDYLDEKGILVLSEFNNWPPFMNDRSSEPELFASKLIRQNFNHPSIFGWSVGNENGNLKENPEVNNYVASIIRFIKSELDSSRLVTYVSNTADFQDDDAAKYCDVIMINKYGSYAKGVDELKKRYPGKAVFMSEYGSHTDNLIYDTPDKTLFKSLMTDSIGNRQNLFGYSLWTFNDYRSNYQAPNPATTTPLHQNRQWGIVDVYRNKKRAFRQMQNFYAPVKKMEVAVLQSNSNKLSVEITPRGILDIPSFELNGYSLVCEERDEKNKNIKSDFIFLPKIKPGSESLTYSFDFSSDKTSFCKVSLLSPTGYVVVDTIVNIKTPPSPVISEFITSSNSARVIFNRNDFSKEYVVKYSVDGIAKSLPPTINHYADIVNLPYNKSCKVWVTAINDTGESAPSEVKEFVAKPGYTALPPVIWLSEPANNGFFTGYSFHYSDVIYQVRFGNSIADTNNWKIISTGNFGMAHVPGLKNGEKYYYQLARRSGFNASGNSWSEIKEIIPNSDHQFGEVVLHGFEQKGDKLLISITPLSNASGYTISCKTNKGVKIYPLNFSDVSLFMLSLEPDVIVNDVEIKPFKNS